MGLLKLRLRDSAAARRALAGRGFATLSPVEARRAEHARLRASETADAKAARLEAHAARMAEQARRAERRHKSVPRTRSWLIARYPKAFTTSADKHPLKIGIDRDLLARHAGNASPGLAIVIRATLQDYTSGHSYLAGMVAGAERIDLDGQPAGVVTEAQATRAADMLGKPPSERIDQRRHKMHRAGHIAAAAG